MTNPYMQNSQPKTRMTVLVFIKGSAAPIVMYVENPISVYEELKKLIETGQNKFYERECQGPIKKIAFLTGQVAALAIQEEPYI